MSNFYLDIIKDRLYCEKEDSELRRAAQTAMYKILSAIARLAAPIISFTAEEIWQYMPHSSDDDTESIFLNQMPEKSGIEPGADFVEKWSFIYATRETVNKLLEEKRNEKVIGKSLEAAIVISCGDDDSYNKYSSLAGHLAEILIVSDVKVVRGGDGETVFEVVKAEGEKCERCWRYSPSVRSSSEHPTLCGRCASVVE